MDTIMLFLSSFRKGNIMLSVDLKDFYLQNLIHPDLRQYLCFPSEGQFPSSVTVLWPFNSTPGLYQGVYTSLYMGTPTGYLPSHYLGDWLAVADSLPHVLKHHQLLQFATTWGWSVWRNQILILK